MLYDTPQLEKAVDVTAVASEKHVNGSTCKRRRRKKVSWREARAKARELAREQRFESWLASRCTEENEAVGCDVLGRSQTTNFRNSRTAKLWSNCEESMTLLSCHVHGQPMSLAQKLTCASGASAAGSGESGRSPQLCATNIYNFGGHSNCYQLFVKIWSGASVTIDGVYPWTTVSGVMHILEDKIGVTMSLQSLSLRSRVLVPSHTLRQACVRDHDTLLLSLRLQGGSESESQGSRLKHSGLTTDPLSESPAAAVITLLDDRLVYNYVRSVEVFCRIATPLLQQYVKKTDLLFLKSRRLRQARFWTTANEEHMLPVWDQWALLEVLGHTVESRLQPIKELDFDESDVAMINEDVNHLLAHRHVFAHGKEYFTQGMVRDAQFRMQTILHKLGANRNGNHHDEHQFEWLTPGEVHPTPRIVILLCVAERLAREIQKALMVIWDGIPADARAAARDKVAGQRSGRAKGLSESDLPTIISLLESVPKTVQVALDADVSTALEKVKVSAILSRSGVGLASKIH